MTDIRAIAADPFARWIGMGDYGEFIGFNDGRRFDPDAVSDRIRVSDLGKLGKKCMEEVRDFLLPIKDKCVGILQGNHERQYERHLQQQFLTDWLCVELGARNLGYSAIFDLLFRRNSTGKTMASTTRIRVFAHHGAGFAQTPGGKLNKLIQAMHIARHADLVLLAHVHDETAKRLVSLDCDEKCGKIVEHTQLGVITGSYLKTYSDETVTYAEQRLYSPVPLGAAVVEITPCQRQMAVTI